MGKAIVILGLIIAAIGLVIWAAPSLPLLGRFGRLPGDIVLRRGNATFYFPLMSSIVLSLVLSLLFALMRR